MNVYVYDIIESYQDSIIGHLGNTGTTDFLLHVVKFWCAYEVDKNNRAITMVMCYFRHYL